MNNQPTRLKNMAYAVVAGQAGCLTLIIIVVALLVGLWLDAQFRLRGPFTIGLLLLSIPISLFVMVRIALGSVRMIQPQREEQRRNESHTEEG